MSINELIEISNKKLEQAKSENNEKNIMLYEKISQLFKDQPALFFEIDMENALKILLQLLPEDQVKEAYKSLISPEQFEELRRKFKI